MDNAFGKDIKEKYDTGGVLKAWFTLHVACVSGCSVMNDKSIVCVCMVHVPVDANRDMQEIIKEAFCLQAKLRVHTLVSGHGCHGDQGGQPPRQSRR